MTPLTRTAFDIDEGSLSLWMRPAAGSATRPLVIGITDAFAPMASLMDLDGVLAGVADVALMRLPGEGESSAAGDDVAGLARALGRVIEDHFNDRLVVLLGLGLGAVVGMTVRAAAVRRLVAVEPVLVTGRAWPLVGGLRAKLSGLDTDDPLRRFIAGAYGVSDTLAPGRNYRASLAGTPPTDIILGSVPLGAPRELARPPSLVDEAERRLVAQRPGVRLHVIDQAGHDVYAEAPHAVQQVLLSAVQAVDDAPSDEMVDASLLARAALGGRHALYLGPRAPNIAGGLLPRAPHLQLRDEMDGPPVDLALVDDATQQDLGAVCSALAPEGVLVARWPAGAHAEEWRGLGLDIVRVHYVEAVTEPFDDRTGDLWPGWRDAPPARVTRDVIVVAVARPVPAPRLDIGMVTFIQELMDVRTRLPAQALRSDPDLLVSCLNAPAALPQAPVEAPKVLILQRPALEGAPAWRNAIAASLRMGWVVAVEFDDHPALVSALGGRAIGDGDWDRFRYAMAIQTSTETLAQTFRHYNPEVAVFPNAVFAIPPPPRTPRPRRVIYAAINRGPLAVEMARSLGPVVDRFADLEFTVISDRAVFEALPTRRKQFLEHVPYARYLDLLAASSVSLSPLEDTEANRGKSDVKFIEAAARGAVTIASPTVYAASVRHGDTGYIAASPADWAPLLAEALRDEEARLRMAQRAWRYVREERLFASQIAARKAWYWSLWNRRAELTERVCERLPGLREALRS